MLLATVIRFRTLRVHTRRRGFEADVRTIGYVPGAGGVFEVRGADVIYVFGVEGRQHIRCVEGCSAIVIGTLEVFFGGVELHGLVEIQIAHVIDRQLVVEAEAVGEVEFHGGLGSLRGKGINSGRRGGLHSLFSTHCKISDNTPQILWQRAVEVPYG